MVFYILIFFNIVHRVSEYIANKYLHKSYFRIGFSNENLNLDVNTYQHIMNPPNVYRADPFLVEKFGNYYIFFEEYSFLDAKGSIAAIEISNRKEVRELGKILEDDFHMSFPFVFEDNDEFYMARQMGTS